MNNINNNIVKCSTSEEYKQLLILSELAWDKYFLDMAQFVSQKSKDPSTKTGAIIVNDANEVIGTGYNGFSRGVLDDKERYENRELKYKLVCHCEMNAILFCNQRPINSTLYTYPFMSCSQCAKYVVQSGITRCVAPKLPDHLVERWKEDMELAQMIFKEAGVQLDILDYK